jgi:hypothetical protein
VNAEGKVDYRKLHEWKETYHDARCLMQTADLLKRMGGAGGK